ncbi:MAG TPA: universal stress protein [Kiloniellaceae bacterium]|nr:universal stress protein [Kiloniellaceae bacterium]
MFDNILLPLDLGDLESQEKAIATAASLSAGKDTRLHILSVVPDLGEGFLTPFFPRDFQAQAMEEARKQLEAMVLERFPERNDVSPLISHGTIYREILKVAEDCSVDLIVMASHRPDQKNYLLGPNAARVVRHANCSVLVVRDDA